MREQDLIQPERKYIEVQYDPVTQRYLREYCIDNGFDLTVKFDGISTQSPEDFDFHSTVCFTTSEHVIENGSLECNIKVTPVGFALFGERKNILVLEVESQGLTDMREYYASEFQMEDEWPDYRPHITVCYNYDGDDVPEVPLPTKPLVANQLNIKTQKKF